MNRPYEGALYQVPVLAGASPPRKLLTNIDTAITFSPDGKQFAYGMANAIARESALMIANSDGSGACALVTKKGPQFGDFPWLVHKSSMVARWKGDRLRSPNFQPGNPNREGRKECYWDQRKGWIGEANNFTPMASGWSPRVATRRSRADNNCC